MIHIRVQDAFDAVMRAGSDFFTIFASKMVPKRSPGGLGRALGPLLEASWALLGSSWAALGRSWEALWTLKMGKSWLKAGSGS